MGIINSLRNKFNNANQKQNQHPLSRVELKEVELFSPQFRTKGQHNYGREITQIFTAKVKINSDSYGEATILNDGNIPICVEIPDNTILGEVLNEKMLEVLHNNGYFDRMSKDHYNMLGRITIENGMPKINEMSQNMVKAIKTLNLDQELKEEVEELRKKFEERNREWQQRDAKLMESVMKRNERQDNDYEL